MPTDVQKRYTPWLMWSIIAAIVALFIEQARLLNIFPFIVYGMWGLSSFQWKDWKRVATALAVIGLLIFI